MWTLSSSRIDKHGSKSTPYGDSTHSLTFFREYVLRDLRPYLCTFEECDMKMFADRDTWFNHELRHHRIEWFCPFCTDTPLQSLESFESHLQSCHAQKVTTKHITALAEVCQRSINKFSPQDCLFCDEWSTELRNANPELSEDSKVVTPAQLQHHIGSHMEQLALFSLPRDDGDVAYLTGVAAGRVLSPSLERLSLGGEIPSPRLQRSLSAPKPFTSTRIKDGWKMASE